MNSISNLIHLHGAHRREATPPAGVLVVAGDAGLVAGLPPALLRAGFNPGVARTAARALEVVATEGGLSVIVLDTELADMSGLELLRKLSRMEQSRAIRVIVVSAEASVDHVLNALRLGAFDFLPKPVHAEELVDVVRRAVADDRGPPPQRELSRAEAAQLLLSARRKRDAIFGEDLFEDPSWNIMLDLYASSLRGRKVVVTDLCVASGTSATTALRRLGTLAALGLIERIPDPEDRRRVLVVQTDRGRAAMDQFAEWLRDTVSEQKSA